MPLQGEPEGGNGDDSPSSDGDGEEVVTERTVVMEKVVGVRMAQKQMMTGATIKAGR